MKDIPLDGYDLWMVRQNVEHAKTEGAETVVNRLRAGGYERIAAAVQREIENAVNFIPTRYTCYPVAFGTEPITIDATYGPCASAAADSC